MWTTIDLQTSPYTQDRKRLKEEVDHSRLVGGSFNNQGKLLYKTCLGWPQNKISVPGCQVLEIYREALPQIVSIIPYSLKSMSLEQLPLWEQRAKEHSKDKDRSEEQLIAQDQLKGQLLLCFFDYFLQHKKKDWPEVILHVGRALLKDRINFT